MLTKNADVVYLLNCTNGTKLCKGSHMNRRCYNFLTLNRDGPRHFEKWGALCQSPWLANEEIFRFYLDGLKRPK